MSVILKTTVGDMTFNLYTKDRPRASLNFLKLCKVKFYNFALFHKVERNFIAQSGDPTGTGRGGESIFCRLYGEQAKLFEAEKKPIIKHKKIGTLSMVNDGNGMHGSQFFITLNEDLDYLDGVHTVFGELIEGLDVIKSLNETICDEANRPYKDIRICHTVILEDPFDDPSGLVIPDRSPEPSKEVLKTTRIAADEEIDDSKGKSMEEIEEEIKDKEAKARAIILEMVGDIPDAEIKPPDNVLFVCKLNPVTTSEDLEIIFSRFGKILSCEVIKDKKTGDSLQYAFIEFEKPKDCENAYFKMDNVLIDDRRIHVDFSQSVSKIKWKGKGKGVEYYDNPKPAKQPKPSKFAIKEKAKALGSGKYDLIFDDDDEEPRSRPKQRKERSESPNNKKSKSKHRKKESHKTRSKNYDSSSSSDSYYKKNKSKRYASSSPERNESKKKYSKRERRRSSSVENEKRDNYKYHSHSSERHKSRKSEKSHKHSKHRRRSRSSS
ncbi:peptidyl-prolyl cis-trans isomerase-like 4 isoform X1 [Centruroides sculpturatus]|uniref:peptidyl-prolyl cis-trans isomerase-like 4 isoform X1 n=1 Tax=Centruroides sculpturatus TaxID=218467 RepID=UPI000C6DB5E3|nr:peptidyl-prolyl cis-trans isomerase-like 4 isoform X1 [Centruroides sculpturatus]XP_023233024.1 peptidyl-prolyl cis-trans isomerase-like 4 isoform X1 [Centruroides sculpturatus]